MLTTSLQRLCKHLSLFIFVSLWLVSTGHAALPSGSPQSTACYYQQQEGELFKAWVVNPYSDMPYLDAEELNKLRACDSAIIQTAKNTKLDFRVVLAPKSTTAKTIKINTGRFRSSTKSTSLSANTHYVQNWYQAFGGWHSIGRPTFMPDRSIYIPELLVNDDTLVTPIKDLQRNSIKISDVNGSRQFTPTENAEDTPRKNYLATSLPLLDAPTFQPMHLKDDSYRQLWISVDIPSTAESGTYKSEIIFTNESFKKQTITLSFNTAPLALKPTQKIYSVYYKGRLESTLSNWVGSDFKGPEQLVAELKDMKNHGITNPVIYQPLDNMTLFEKYLSLREQAGYSNDTIYLIYLNTSQATLDSGTLAFKYNLDKVRKTATPYGAKNIYLYGEDEATAQQLLTQESAWNIASKQGFNIFAAGSAYPAPAHAPGLKIFNSARSPNPTQAKILQKNGIKVLNYANPQGGAESPFIYRRNYGVVLWAAKYDGAMIYAYQDSMGDGWNDFDNSYRDHNLTYPSAEGPIATIAWQGLTAGIEDMRYLETLESLVNSTLKSNPHDSSALKARAFLDKLRNNILPYLEPDDITRDFYMDHQKMRDDIIQLMGNISNPPVPLKIR